MHKAVARLFSGSCVPLTLALALSLPTAALAEPPAEDSKVITPKQVIPVGTRPESITKGWGGKLYVTVMNAADVAGDGVIKVLDGDLAKDFAKGFDEPKGICFTGKLLIASDVKRVWSIDEKGATTVLAAETDFPHPPSFLNDIACEPGGKAIYVTDMGANTKMRDPNKKLWPLDSAEAKALPAIGRVYRVGLDKKIELVVDARSEMPCPNGVSAPAKGRLLIAEFFTGTVFDVRGKTWKTLVTGLRGADGVEEDGKGNLIVSSWEQGKVWRVRPGKDGPKQITVIAEGYQSAADFYLDRKAKTLFLPDMKAGTVSVLSLD